MKGIIIYYSQSGNTGSVAKELARKFDMKTERLHVVEPYSASDLDGEDESSRCYREYRHPEMRPAIKPVDVNFADYDTILLGFPIWWYREPNLICTFLDTYGKELKGKAIYPFSTSYQSPETEADISLEKTYPDLDIKKGLRFPATAEEITEWINQ